MPPTPRPTRRRAASAGPLPVLRGSPAARGHPAARGRPVARGRTASRGRPAARGRPPMMPSPVGRRSQSSVPSTAMPGPSMPAAPTDFEDAHELQLLVGGAEPSQPSRAQWEASVQQRLDRSDKLLHEMHALLKSVVSAGVSAAGASAASVSAAGASAAGASAAGVSAAGVSATGVSAAGASATSVPAAGASATSVPAAGASAAGASAAGVSADAELHGGVPWPSASASASGSQGCLHIGTGEQASVFASSSLPVYAHVPIKLRKRIWEGEFVELASLLKDRPEQANYAITIRSVEGNPEPVMCVAPKPKQNIGSFQRWLKAFEVYISIYLLQPGKVADAGKLLQYISTIRNLAERGGDWAQYDETFRSMRMVQGWQWDAVHWELWLNSQQTSGGVISNQRSPFPDKGRRVGSPRLQVCFNFNRGVPCRQPCQYAHKCRRCGGNHPSSRCFKKGGRGAAASSAKK